VSIDYDVAVVGYGPAGEVAASTVGAAGHRVVVFERHRQAYPLPRMVTFDGEACRTLQATGTDIDHALRNAVVLESCNFGDADADVLLHIDWRGTQCGFQAHYSVFQPDVEASLQERVDAMPNVDVHRGTEVIALTQHAYPFVLTVRPKGTTETAEQWTVRARYVVGADGTNSFVREAAGIAMRDHGMHERWVNFDMDKLTELPAQFDELIMIMDPRRPRMYMPLGTTRQRFEARVDDSETDEEMYAPEVAWRYLDEHHGLGPDQLSICRQTVYHYYTRVAEQWRQGRVLIAGDAAHTMTPYLGQGGCSAIRDGRNVGWKLALVLSGQAEESLLDEYQTEREPHVSALVFTSHALAEMVNIVDEEAAAQRNHALRNHLAPPPPPFPKLEHGVLHREADGTIAPVTGSLSPQGPLRKGGQEGRGDDVLGHGFQLISRTALPLGPAQREVLGAIGCGIAVLDDPADPDAVDDVDGTYRAFLDAHGVDAYLTRPDWYVFGAVQAADLAALVDELGELLHVRVRPAVSA
jgi:3-(3-hydroxy-phenyl)propionate hydroxylase